MFVFSALLKFFEQFGSLKPEPEPGGLRDSLVLKQLAVFPFLQNFLVVADVRRAETELSVIYRWNRRRRQFLRYQTLETHAAQDWEAFRIHNQSFLVVANHRRGEQEFGLCWFWSSSCIAVL